MFFSRRKYHIGSYRITPIEVDLKKSAYIHFERNLTKIITRGTDVNDWIYTDVTPYTEIFYRN